MYQCELALLELLRRNDPSLDVSIELLDDIAFEGLQTTMLQTKLQITPGNLTDGSADLWKTLRVWSAGGQDAPGRPARAGYDGGGARRLTRCVAAV